MTLSHALAEVVRDSGWSQKRLEDATEIKQDRLSRMLTGARNNRPTLEDIAKIEQAIGKPPGFVLGLAGLVTIEGVRAGEQHYAQRVSPAAAEDQFAVAADTGTQKPRIGRKRAAEPAPEPEMDA